MSDSRIVKVQEAIESELASWMPAGNIQRGVRFTGKFSPGEPVSLVQLAAVEQERAFNTLQALLCEVEVHLGITHLDSDEREEELHELADEVCAHFEGNVAPFSEVSDYYDTRGGGVALDAGVFADGVNMSSAVVKLICRMKQ